MPLPFENRPELFGNEPYSLKFADALSRRPSPYLARVPRVNADGAGEGALG